MQFQCKRDETKKRTVYLIKLSKSQAEQASVRQKKSREKAKISGGAPCSFMFGKNIKNIEKVEFERKVRTDMAV